VQVAFAPTVPTTVPSLLIVGTDAVLAAAPATPVQLAHACMAVGFHAVIPASWGDELVAARAIEHMRAADAPMVQCTCPHVARRLATHGDAIAPMLLCFVAPPVAAALYLRAVYAPARPRITFAGGCPSALHESIDVWLSADELLSTFAERGVSASAQPTEFDSVIPPDRRRYFSDAGGVPSRAALRQLAPPVEVVEIIEDDLVLGLAQQLLSGSRSLIDVAVPLGCCCSGAVGGVSADIARSRVREHEPPRALSPVIDQSIHVDLELPPPTSVRAIPVVPPIDPVVPGAPPLPELTPEPALITVEPVPRRRSPPGLARPVLGTTPLRRSAAGRQLPRAYVARLRSSPRGLRQSSLRNEEPGVPLADGQRKRWIIVAAVGVAVGLGLAFLVRLVL
jgi:hypothetical protein